MTIRTYQIQISSTNPRLLKDIAEFLHGYERAIRPGDVIISSCLATIDMNPALTNHVTYVNLSLTDIIRIADADQ